MTGGARVRVAVWLDPTAPQENALEVLTGLGSASEILGLFVEDTNLINLSNLSVAREITIESATARQLDAGRIERQFRAHAARMRGMFETAARKTSARQSFRVARGELKTELLKLSADCDMLVIAHSRRHFGSRLTLRTQLGELLVGGPPTLVFVQEQWQTGDRIAVWFDGDSSSDAALRTAGTIAYSESLALSIWLPNVSAEQQKDLKERAAKELSGFANLAFRILPTRSVDDLVQAAQVENPRALILPGAETAETHRQVAELLDRVNCSVIVAR